MGSATWFQIPSHAGWGEGGVTMEGEMRSGYGGQHCKVAESASLGLQPPLHLAAHLRMAAGARAGAGVAKSN
eukprot:scaffold18575_cov104-Isochrysis_galbana.AAC.4